MIFSIVLSITSINHSSVCCINMFNITNLYTVEIYKILQNYIECANSRSIAMPNFLQKCKAMQ